MKLTDCKLWTAAVALLAGAAQASAANITIGDPNTLGETLSGWHKGGTSPASEYQEVEPGMQTGSVWDLVAFTAEAGTDTLGVLSGYDLKNGHNGTRLGDIFIADSAPTWYPEPYNYTQFTTNTFNFDYALRLDLVTNQYSVYALNAGSILENAYYYNSGDHNPSSNPWRYSSGGSLIGTFGLEYNSGTTAAAASALAGFAVTGDYKYSVTLQDMDWYTADVAVLHLTMECGNDNLYGYTDGGFQRVPDGAATVVLIGLGLLGLAGVRRFSFRR